MCIYSVLSCMLSRNMQKRKNNIKQFINAKETAIDLVKNKRDIIRQIDTNDMNQSFMTNQVKQMFYHIHPNSILENLTITRDEYTPIFKALSRLENNLDRSYYYEISAAVGQDGITVFSHKTMFHKKVT